MKFSKKIALFALSSALLGASATTLAAGDAAAGKTKAATCAACHGANGISATGMWPNLAGQKEAYLVKQLKDFRSGKRSDPVMNNFAKPLSDADIANLAAYYTSL